MSRLPNPDFLDSPPPLEPVDTPVGWNHNNEPDPDPDLRKRNPYALCHDRIEPLRNYILDDESYDVMLFRTFGEDQVLRLRSQS